MIDKIHKGDKEAYLWIPQHEVEPSALQQIYDILQHDGLVSHLAIMPDVHYGKGATIGSVIPIAGVIPSAIGVDLGCGIFATRLNLKKEHIVGYEKVIHDQICRDVPRGFNDHRDISRTMPFAEELDGKLLQEDIGLKAFKPLENQVGTLGGGNHFIEIQYDEQDFVWIMIHSGSRNIGAQLSSLHIKKAAEKKNATKDLEWFEFDSPEFNEYLYHLNWACQFAIMNRYVMSRIVYEAINRLIPCQRTLTIDCTHNYAQALEIDNHKAILHRKGATSAEQGELGVIPGSMGSSSFIVQGKGCADSYSSCSHGAGRKMSRNKAKEHIKIETFKEQMTSVYSGSIDMKHLDEAPDAYKDIQAVMGYQKELVDIVYELKPLININFKRFKVPSISGCRQGYLHWGLPNASLISYEINCASELRGRTSQFWKTIILFVRHSSHRLCYLKRSISMTIEGISRRLITRD